jgi:hypothetical protein
VKLQKVRNCARGTQRGAAARRRTSHGGGQS